MEKFLPAASAKVCNENDFLFAILVVDSAVRRVTVEVLAPVLLI